MSPQTAQQIPGVYHRKIGDILVTAISDGYLDGTVDVMRNVDGFAVAVPLAVIALSFAWWIIYTVRTYNIRLSAFRG